MRLRRLLGLALIGFGAVSHAQDRVEAEIPPLPRQERLVPRGELQATLRLTSRVLAGETPAFSVVFENTGTTTIRIPPRVQLGDHVVWRIIDPSGGDVPSVLSCVAQRMVVPVPVRELLALRPGQSRVLPLDVGCGSVAYLPPLPVGEYEVRAIYRNYPDWPWKYDVYERGGADAWDGEIAMAPVALTVEPLDEATERRLIESLDDDAVGEDAIRRVGLNRSSAAVDPLLRRLERDAFHGRDAITALAHIGGPSVAGRTALAIERLFLERRDMFMQIPLPGSAQLSLLQHSDDCDGLPLLVVPAVPITTTTARMLEERCGDLRARLQAMGDAALPPDRGSLEGTRVAMRSVAARALLEALDRPAPIAIDAPPRVALPEIGRLAGYVATVIGGMQNDEAYDQAVTGMTRFGTMETFAQLREALVPDNEQTRWRIGNALVAMTFHGDYLGQETASPAYWERWWRANRRRSREQWAEEALRRRDPRELSLSWGPMTSKWRAAEYLVTARGGAPRILRDLSAHRSWRVRLGAADALVPFDRRTAGRLMVRELDNRHVAPCAAASGQLEALTGTRYRVDCLDGSARQRAIVHWTRVVDTLIRQ